MRDINAIVIHCSATPDGDARFTRDWIDAEHRKPKNGRPGWQSIGYHWVVHVDGSVHAGRPEDAIGAHVEGNNARTIGVCMIGTARFTAAQWDSLRALVEDLKERYPAAIVCGHRDYSPDLNGDGLIDPWEWFKVCPGFDVREWVLEGMATLWNPAHLVTHVAGVS